MALIPCTSSRLKSTWDPVVKSFKLRLASWKRKLLSFGGMLALIKSVLSNLSMFKMPKGVAKVLDKLQASFLWVGSDLKRRRVHLVKWSEQGSEKRLRSP